MLLDGRFSLRCPQNLMISVGFVIFSVDFDSRGDITGCHVTNFSAFLSLINNIKP